MPNFSGKWNLQGQLQGIKAGTWTGIEQYELWAWGNNGSGRLGLNDDQTVDKSSPVQVGTLADWSQVATGGAQALAIKTDGTLWAWGDNGSGRLGLNDDPTVDRSSPVQVGILTDWAQVATRFIFVAAVKTDGTLWAWGDNGDGRLGLNDNQTVDKSSPVQVGALTNWSQVSTGAFHAAAIKTDGTLWSWGKGQYGPLGHNDEITRSSPVQVGASTNWSQVSSSTYHTAAVKTDGTLWAWGDNTRGQLGDNTVVYRSSPVQVGALTTWAQVSTGGAATFAVKTDGTLWAWGLASYGRLGTNNQIDRSSPVQIGALTTWSKVSSSTNETGGALKTDGTLWTWGGNGEGRLGLNDTINRSSPVQVGNLTNWSDISAGSAFFVAIYSSRTGM